MKDVKNKEVIDDLSKGNLVYNFEEISKIQKELEDLKSNVLTSEDDDLEKIRKAKDLFLRMIAVAPSLKSVMGPTIENMDNLTLKVKNKLNDKQ
jgi:hypothetical protein